VTRLLGDPAGIGVELDAIGLPRRVDIPGAGWHEVVAVCARWRVETDWWRAPVTREYWKLGLKTKTSGSGGTEPDVLCDVYRDRTEDRWRLTRVYD